MAGGGACVPSRQLRRLLELKTVPCIELGHLSEAQKRAYIIADNKLALSGGWNEDLLRMELTDLKALGANLELTGFDLMELADITLGKDTLEPARSRPYPSFMSCRRQVDNTFSTNALCRFCTSRS